MYNPLIPGIGPIEGSPGIEYTFMTITSDPDDDQVLYQWDWGDGTMSEWIGPIDSEVEIFTNHTWSTRGNFEIRVKAKDTVGEEGPWSSPLPIEIPRFRPNYQSVFSKFLENYPIIARLFNYIKILANSLPII